MWEISQGIAQFSASPLTGRVELAAPDRGITELRFRGRSVDAELLSVRFGGQSGTPPLSEAYVRGGDLIARYQTTAGQVEPEIYWQGSSAGFQLLVSAQTQRLQSEPRTRLITRLPRGEVLVRPAPSAQWEDPPGETRFQRRDLAPTWHVDRPHTVLVRHQDAGWQYCETVFPSDLVRLTLHVDATHVTIESELFPESLEKGVIRRGRVQAWLVDLSESESSLVERIGDFLLAPPPLTT